MHFHEDRTPGASQHFRRSSDELFVSGDQGLTTMFPHFTLSRDTIMVFKVFLFYFTDLTDFV